MSGYLTPGEIATLRSRRAAMLAGEQMVGEFSPLGSDEDTDAIFDSMEPGWDDETDLRNRSIPVGDEEGSF